MNIEQDVLAFLSNETGVAGIIGGGLHSRIFEHIARQSVRYPLLVLDESGGQTSNQIDGGDTELARSDFACWCLDMSTEGAIDLWHAVLAALRGFGPEWMGGTFVHEANIIGPWRARDYFIGEGSQNHIYYVRANFNIWYNTKQTVPEA